MKFVTSDQILLMNQEIISACYGDQTLQTRIEGFYLFSDLELHFFLEQEDLCPFQNDTMTNEYFISMREGFSTAFPDYDFSSTIPQHFKLIRSNEQVISSLVWFLVPHTSDTERIVQNFFFNLAIEIDPPNCLIYQYQPNCSDAFSEAGVTSHLSYFYINPNSKKMLLLSFQEGVNADASDSEPELEDRYGYGLF